LFMNICAVIPAYNSESTIVQIVEKTRRFINHIVVVDDGSDDETAKRAQGAGAHVIRVSQNTGKGNALRVSFKYALSYGYDAVLTLDADLQHDPEDIPKFLDYHKAHGANLIIGARLEEKTNIPWVRYVPNLVGARAFSWLVGKPVLDSQSGFRLYDRHIMQSINIVKDGFEAEADILLRAGRRGYAIGFVPIKAIYFAGHRHPSFYRPVRDTFHICIIFLKNLFWKNR
jgi:glycosyltransferase involved in cell wall biosynthesis